MSSSRGIAALVALVLFACGGPTKPDADEPQTAREKQLREAKAKGELDGPQRSWGTWRYAGNRADCFYVLGRRCFKTEKGACKAANCARKKKKCKVEGGGPATVSCK